MRKTILLRFWLETGLAALTGILFVITLVSKDWIEIVFDIDPDAGSGSLEWLIVGVFLALTVLFVVLARFEWRRLRVERA